MPTNHASQNPRLRLAVGLARRVSGHDRHPVAPKRAGQAQRLNGRRGFTLVEMLIAVALVLLMMTLFATIFQIATGAMSTQKGLGENDQRVRLVITRLRNDLNSVRNDPNDPSRPYRTFRNLVPYGPDENLQINFSETDRSGYFYISENNPDDDTDDVIAFTIQFPTTSSDQFYGQAAVVLPDLATGSYGTGNPSPGAGYPPNGNATVPVAAAPGAGQSYWPNQPDFDDITGIPNKVASAEQAEVCYFLRRGVLYRRVMLIRDPNVLPKPSDGTPTDNLGGTLSLATYTNENRAFWNDFDFSAVYWGAPPLPGPRFHGGDNTSARSLTIGGGTNPFVLGNPAYRFGFDATVAGGAPSGTYGQPVEFIGAAPGTFIGRFTHAETSDVVFGYPGVIAPTSSGVNPMQANALLAYNATTGQVGYVSGANTVYYSGPRSGEDILMTNVIKFDIKVFDPAATFGPDGLPGVGGVDDDNNGIIDDTNELGWPGSDDGDFVDIGHMGLTGFYNAGPYPGRTAQPLNVPITMRRDFPVPPTVPTAYVYPNTRYSDARPAYLKNRYDTWNPQLDHDGDGINDCPPFRPFNFGADKRPGFAFTDDDGDGTQDNISELGWPGSDDRPIPLSAIQIKIAFFDTTSGQIREVTLVQSLLYQP